MRSAPVTDARALPRPDLSPSAIATRIQEADPISVANPSDPGLSYSEPAACSREFFIPVSKRVVRFCNSAFPMTQTLAKKYSMPFGAIIQPLARPGKGDSEVPVVNFGSSGIVRCRRCRSYINFSCSFRDGGRRWVCSMCGFSNDVPSDYFSPLDQYGKRRDAAERPELRCGSVEFVAPAEYMVRPPMPPVYVFVLETTPAAVASGALQAALAGIKRSIGAMPKNEGRTRVGLMTFDSSVSFYALRGGDDAEPSVYVVSDIDDVFLPTPENILVQLSECRPCFERALDLIAEQYGRGAGQMASGASCFGAAIKGALKAMEFLGGKMVVLAASRPTVGPGKLRERGDPSMLGTDRERSVLRVGDGTYRQIAVSMSKSQVSCDMFLCPPLPGHYMDVASLGQLAKITGGELFYCPNFDAPKDLPRLQLALNRLLVRETGLEAVMRIRATKSVRCSHFSGRFFVRSSDLLAMPSVDSDKAYAVQFSFDESSLSDGPFCLQVALLYTTTSGERRIRVHTLAVPVTNSLADLFMRVDAPTTANLFIRQAAESMKDRSLEELKKNLTEKVIQALAKYREVCLSQYPAGRNSTELLLPDAMILLPLYMHGLAKSPILSRDACGAFLYKFDDKAALALSVDVMNVSETTAMVYPNIVEVYPGPAGGEKPSKHPNGLPATVASLKTDVGVLIDDGRCLILWLGNNAHKKFTVDLLGNSVKGPVDPRILAVELMRRGSSAKGDIGRVYVAVNSIMTARNAGIPFHVVPAGDQRMQPRVEALMTEDRTAASVNYREFLLEVQRRVTHVAARK